MNHLKAVFYRRQFTMQAGLVLTHRANKSSLWASSKVNCSFHYV